MTPLPAEESERAHASWRSGENRSDLSHPASCSLSYHMTRLMDRDFDVRLGPVSTLMSMCGLAVEVELPSNGDEKPAPFNYEGPPRDCCYFASLFHVRSLCAPSVCRFEWRLNDGFPLRTWHITLMPSRPAGWEKTAAARHSSQPHQSQRRQTWRPRAPWKTCSLTSLLSVTQQREADWLNEVENTPNVRLSQTWWIG